MAQLFRSQPSAEPGNIDRDYRVIGWWGMALAAFGIAVLLFAMASFAVD